MESLEIIAMRRGEAKISSSQKGLHKKNLRLSKKFWTWGFNSHQKGMCNHKHDFDTETLIFTKFSLFINKFWMLWTILGYSHNRVKSDHFLGVSVVYGKSRNNRNAETYPFWTCLLNLKISCLSKYLVYQGRLRIEKIPVSMKLICDMCTCGVCDVSVSLWRRGLI